MRLLRLQIFTLALSAAIYPLEFAIGHGDHDSGQIPFSTELGAGAGQMPATLLGGASNSVAPQNSAGPAVSQPPIRTLIAPGTRSGNGADAVSVRRQLVVTGARGDVLQTLSIGSRAPSSIRSGR